MSDRSFDFDSDAEASAFDELPLWAAPFGLRLLELVRLAPELRVLDVGFGTGFPLFELAMWLGPRATLHGLDPWPAAQRRAAFKRDHGQLQNVQLHRGVAEAMPFAEDAFDCVISNNGYNNVTDRARAFQETARVCRAGAQYAADAGFSVEHVLHDAFAFRFASASALMNHGFFRRTQLPPLRGLVTADRRDAVFVELEQRLDERGERDGELRLTVPFAVVPAVRLAGG